MSLNVVPFPVASLNDIPEMLHRFADDLEADIYGTLKTLVLTLETADGLHCFGWGHADDPVRNAGLLEAAKNMQIDLAFPE